MPIASEHAARAAPQPRRKQHAWWSAALLVGVVLVVSGFATNTDLREARALRSYGAIVAVTVGDEPLVLGTTWQKWLLGRFPWLADFVGGTAATRRGIGVQDLVIWRNNRGGPLWLGPPNGLLLLTDDQGRTRELPVDGPVGSSEIHGWNTVHPFLTVRLADLPTDCKLLRLRTKPCVPGEIEHESFVLSNPNYKP